MPRPRSHIDPFIVAEVSESSGDAKEYIATAGGRLRQEREAQQIPVKEAAHKLNLMVTDLRAIEADSYYASASNDLLRNYLRDYAKFLRLDPDAILAVYDRQAGTGLHRGVDRVHDIPIAKTTGIGSLVTGGLVVMTLVLGFLVLMQFANTSRVNALLAQNSPGQGFDQQQGDSAGNVASPVENSEPISLAAAGASHVLPVISTSEDLPSAGEIEPDKVDAAAFGTRATDDPTAPMDDDAVTAVESADGSVIDSAATAGAAETVMTDELSFRFAKNCWVEVYDADQKRLIAEIRKAGESLNLIGKSPFKVLVGYSREVVLQFNGYPVDIEQIDRSYSTLFTVGRVSDDTLEPVVETIRRALPDKTPADGTT